MAGIETTGESPIDWGLVGAFAEQASTLDELTEAGPEMLVGSESLLQQLVDGYMEQGFSGPEAERLSHAFICGAVAGAVATENTLAIQVATAMFG